MRINKKILEDNKYFWKEVEKEEPSSSSNEIPSWAGSEVSSSGQAQEDLMDLGLVSPGAWCAVDLGEPQLSSCCHLPSPNPLYKIKPLAQDSDLSHTLSALDYCRVLCGHDLSLYLWSIAEVLFLLR